MSHDVPVCVVLKTELRALRGATALDLTVYLLGLKPLADPVTGEVRTTYRELKKRVTPV